MSDQWVSVLSAAALPVIIFTVVLLYCRPENRHISADRRYDFAYAMSYVFALLAFSIPAYGSHQMAFNAGITQTAFIACAFGLNICVIRIKPREWTKNCILIIITMGLLIFDSFNRVNNYLNLDNK